MLIDVFITNVPDKIACSGVSHVGISDHSMIYGIRKINSIRRNRQTQKFKTVRNFKNFNSSDLVRDLSFVPWQSLLLISDPNCYWNKWKELFLNIADFHAPLISKRVQNHHLPWINSEIKTLMLERDRLKRIAVISKKSSNWNFFRAARNKTNSAIRISKSNYYKSLLEVNSNNPKDTWKIINQLLGRSSGHNTVNEIKTATTTLNKPSEICNAFNNFFSEIGPRLAAQINQGTADFRDFLKPVETEFSFQEVRPAGVLHLLQHLSPAKATGLDGIPPKLLIAAAEVITYPLTFLFNLIITSGIFPDDWKSARVSPLFKKGKQNDLDNYRPISILPAISKVFERLMYDQLYGYLSSNNILSDRQFGFRKHYSTTSALIEATNSWFVDTDRGLINIVAFLDLRKAFDTVNHK